MKLDVTVSVDTEPTPRMRQVSSMFDAPISKKASRSWAGEAPIEDRPWSIGLIVGASGAGKSTLARKMFGNEFKAEWGHGSVVDAFSKELSVNAIGEVLSAVGFNTIPAWLRPYGTLSNGEKFRCDLARMLVSPEPLVWVDEFTSVVDRQVAKIGSAALARYVRSTPDRQFVAVGCHYDVIDWLQPDWILEPANMTFAWRSVQPRPRVHAVIKRASRSLWPEFAPYHYMSASLHKAARCYAVYVGDRPVAFLGLGHLPISGGKRAGTAIVRVSRVVVLPDWQGCGVVFRLLEEVASAYKAIGQVFRNYPAHPAFVRAHQRKRSLWLQCADGAKAVMRDSSATSDTSTVRAGGRPCSVFEYIGPAMDKKLAERFLGLG